MPTRRQRSGQHAVGMFRATPGRIERPPGSDRDRPASAPAVVRGATTEHAHEETVLWIVNAVRTKAGLPRLSSDERLRVAARNHSRDMAKRGFCAHVNPDGVTPAQRMAAAGHPSPGGENVAMGQRQPHAVMSAWMASPPHRANILNPEFTTLGVGVHLAEGGPYWTQNFGY